MDPHVDAINFVVGRPDASYLPWSSVGFGPFHAPTTKNPTHLGAGLLNDAHGACFAEFGNRLPWHDVPAGP